MSIGVVLEKLREEFPDITVSKIRFLESEGLVHPQRTASGYRRFTDSDVERLRYVLVTQRDNYTPLKVIREQLEAMDSGQVTPLMLADDAAPLVSPDNFRKPVMTRLTDSDVAENADCTPEDVAELTALGLITPDASGFYTADDARIVNVAVALKEHGFTAELLKQVRRTSVRQAEIVSQVARPVATGSDDTARDRAEEMAQQMTALVVSLHAGLVKNALRAELDS